MYKENHKKLESLKVNLDTYYYCDVGTRLCWISHDSRIFAPNILFLPPTLLCQGEGVW